MHGMQALSRAVSHVCMLTMWLNRMYSIHMQCLVFQFPFKQAGVATKTTEKKNREMALKWRHRIVFSGFCIRLLFLVFFRVVAQELTVDFYNESCPHAEKIIREAMVRKLKEAPTTAGATLRIFFHDCFVDGCDGSVLISSTPDNKAERDADINLSLAGDGFDAVQRAKAAVERVCPRVVSCADILAIITRDLVHLVGGPFWEVAKGRRDGLISKASRVGKNIPTGDAAVKELTELFISKGLTQIDMLALSGAHTIGFAHCVEFMNRIHSFNGSNAPDPTMDPSFADSLKQACPLVDLNPDVVATFDVTTPFQFDNAYYQNMQRGLALLTSDQGLFTDERTRSVVDAFAARQDLFFEVFATSMDKLGRIGIKNETQGVIRSECHKF